jgi:gliding motility-associated-like protein
MRHWLSLIFSIFFFSAYCQQDVDFHIVGTFLTGKNILKVKRDFHDPYLWVLAQNNEVYRINSITKVIDDYTSQFSAYSSMQFIDIAGRSLDTVFIATNSTNVIDYKKGATKVISVADGITTLVNSVGIPKIQPYFGDTYSVLIGSDKGFYSYDMLKEKITGYNNSINSSKIYEATYRDLVYKDSAATYPDWAGRKYVPVLIKGEFTTFQYFMSESDTIGHVINTAYQAWGSIYDYDMPVSYTALFWGTRNGMFQVNGDKSYYINRPYAHYLDGINVNKITTMFGLTGFGNGHWFGNPGLIKQNMLIGTNNGLYFSSSIYNRYSKQLPGTRQVDLFHFDDLGNTAINDICVNTESVAEPICDNGVWVASANGLYLLAPNYAPYVNTATKLQGIEFSGQSNVSQLQLCANSTITAIKNTNTYSGKDLQWYKDGQPLSGEVNTSLIIKSAGDYYAMFYDPCSPIYFESNHLTVSIISAPVFAFNYADTINYCDGSNATLKTDNNASYQYRWYKNGVLNGNTTYTLNTLLPGKYKVEVSACQGNSWVASKEVQVNFVKVPQPIVIADKAAYCAGDQATLSTTVPIDASQIINWAPYSYRWYKDGVLNGKTTAAIAITQPGKYKVEVTSCSGTWVASTETTVAFITLTKPVLVADKPAYCFGDQATLSINFINDGTYTVNWYRDGNIVNTNQNKTTLSSNQAGNYTVSITSNLTTCSLTSDAFALNFNALPTISIQQVVNTTLCDGEPVSLNATFVSGNIKWSTGETANSITVKHSGTYTATATTVAGCSSAQNININFLPNPTLSMRDATLCQFTNETITLTAPIGFKKYEWNGQSGTSSFITGKLGIVTLVVTDNNGCKASKTITISSHCKDIHVPNTFTPNGDGINDTWVISGLENDLSTTVKVYNRFGELMFQSQGYAIAWNGAVNNKKLPAGEYYYIISARDTKQVLSGSLTILY